MNANSERTDLRLLHFAPPPGLPAPPLSYATRLGDILFISGIPGHDEHGDLPDGFDAQFERVVANIKAILLRAGGDWRRIAKANVLLTQSGDVARLNELYARAFTTPYPARTTCIVQALPDPRMLIEIECIVDLRD